MATVERDGDVEPAKRARAIREMFAAISPRYDLLNHLLSFGRDRGWRKMAAELTADESVGSVLDVCAGTGDLGLEYAARMPTGEVVLADFCPEMLRLAREKVRGGRLNVAVRTCVADTTRLPFVDAQFDLSCVAFGMRNVVDRSVGLREMTRVVRRGGRVVVLEFSQPTKRWFRAVYYFYFLRILPVVGRVVSGTRMDAYGYLPRSVLAFSSPQDLRASMEGVGLVEVEVVPLMFGAVTVHIGRKR